MKFKRILICCSLNPQARGMLAQSIEFANAFGDEVRFCHVGPDNPEIRRRLFFLLEDLQVKTPHPILFRSGDPDTAVCRLSDEINADLIMAGALAHESAIVGIFGSVARRIVRRAKCSVLLLTHTGRPLAGFRKLAIDVDYNDITKHLIQFTIDIARHYNAAVIAVHEYDYTLKCLRNEELGNEEAVRKYEKECSAVEDSRLRDFLCTFNWGNIHPVPVCLKGTDGAELSRYGIKSGADLILMPIAAKRNYFWDRFFHSTVEILLQDLPCSILFYRKKQYA